MKVIATANETVFKSSKPAYTSEMKKMISQSSTGTEIIFQNIVVSYPDGTERYFGEIPRIKIK